MFEVRKDVPIGNIQTPGSAFHYRILMRHVALCTFMIAYLTACGGSGGGGSSDIPVPPGTAAIQSPGGVWFGFDSMAESVVLYIAESGELRAVLHPEGGPFASFGGGSVSVTSNDVIDGSFELRAAVSPPLFQQREDLGCSVSGSVVERRSLSVDVICSDSRGVVYDESLTLIYDANSYERGSALDALAGDYTLEFQPDMNSLNVAGDGTIVGMYHNGARCMVSGTAAIIDADYTLIDIAWTMSGCTDLFGIFDGVEMSGFALANPAPTGIPGAYYFLLTGQTQDGVFAVSVLYEPV